jgi:hypothetical protein
MAYQSFYHASFFVGQSLLHECASLRHLSQASHKILGEQDTHASVSAKTENKCEIEW